MMFYKIQPYEGDRSKIYVSSTLYANILAGEKQTVFLHTGLLTKEASVVVMNDLSENEVKITTDILHVLSIPVNLSYQIRIDKNALYLGPIIGLLLSKDGSYFTEQRLEKLLEYALLHMEIQGLLYVFSSNKICFDTNTAQGFYYCPGALESTPKWEYGTFPLPDAIFRRISLPRRILNRLKKITKNRVFNSNYFNKWDFWNMVRENTYIADHIPFTCMYKTFDDIENMFARYVSLFLKPVNGTLGNGLVKATKTKDQYTFQGKHDLTPSTFTSREPAADYVSHLVEGRRYLIQQDIHLIRHKNSPVDFRVNMQKDYTMKWHCTGIIACTGPQGGIHSNYNNEGFYLTFEDFMTNYLSINSEETFRKRQELLVLCTKLCEVIDAHGGNYGDFGIDIGYDSALKPWIFEVNKSQFYSLPLTIHDFTSYYAAKTNPVKYAAALSGFMNQSIFPSRK